MVSSNKGDCGTRQGFLIDMDGVLYRGKTILPGGDTFISTLIERKLPFLFLTNNSRHTRRDIATKLNRMGIRVEEEHIY